MYHPRCCGKAMAHLRKTVAYSKTEEVEIVSDVWECLYCGSIRGIPAIYRSTADNPAPADPIQRN